MLEQEHLTNIVTPQKESDQSTKNNNIFILFRKENIYSSIINLWHSLLKHDRKKDTNDIMKYLNNTKMDPELQKFILNAYDNQQNNQVYFFHNTEKESFLSALQCDKTVAATKEATVINDVILSPHPVVQNESFRAFKRVRELTKELKEFDRLEAMQQENAKDIRK